MLEQKHESLSAMNAELEQRDDEASVICEDADALARYIVRWLRSRNGAQLDSGIAAMTVESFEGMHAELSWILQHGGHPPNWVSEAHAVIPHHELRAPAKAPDPT